MSAPAKLGRPSRPLEHGTVSMYSGRSCRCDLCKQAMNAYQRTYAQRRKNGETRVRKSPAERIKARSVVLDSGCWEWQGHVTKKGYAGYVQLDGKSVAAYRAAYLLFKGEIPIGMQLDHTCHTNDLACPGGRGCRHRRCVNPDHLEPVTNLENTLRGRSVGLFVQKTHCVRGHEYGPRDVNMFGHHACLRCERDQAREAYARAKSAT